MHLTKAILVKTEMWIAVMNTTLNIEYLCPVWHIPCVSWLARVTRSFTRTADQIFPKISCLVKFLENCFRLNSIRKTAANMTSPSSGPQNDSAKWDRKSRVRIVIALGSTLIFTDSRLFRCVWREKMINILYLRIWFYIKDEQYKNLGLNRLG